MKKEQSRDELLHNEMKEKLDNLSVAHEKVKNEKGQLEIYVNELQQKYSVLFNLHAETSTKNNSTAAEKLQVYYDQSVSVSFFTAKTSSFRHGMNLCDVMNNYPKSCNIFLSNFLKWESNNPL